MTWPIKERGITLKLLTLDELRKLQEAAPDTVLINIQGEEQCARDADDDTRFGYVAYGIPIED